jgi:hypothetical protein
MTPDLRTLLLATGLALAANTHAQPQQDQIQPPQRARSQPTDQAAQLGNTFGAAFPSDKRFDLTFPGGTVADYIAAITGQPGVDCNVSLAPDARSLPMPPIRLTNINAAVAIRAVETIADEWGQPLLFTRTIEDNASAPLYSILLTHNQRDPEQPVALRSFRVASLLDSAQGGTMTADSLLGAIESLLSFEHGDGEPAKVLLHKETSTLMMQAPTDQLVAVEDLLVGLERDAIERRNANKPNLSLIADLKAEQQALREKRDILHERMRLAEKAAVETEQMIQQGAAPQSDREQIRERLRELEEQRIEFDLRESHVASRLDEALAATGVRQTETFRVPQDRVEATLEAAAAIVTVMSPPASVERGEQPGQISFHASPGQITAIRRWLRAQNLIVD